MNPSEHAQSEYADARVVLRVAFHAALARRLGYFFPTIDTARNIAKVKPDDSELFLLLTKRRTLASPSRAQTVQAIIARVVGWFR